MQGTNQNNTFNHNLPSLNGPNNPTNTNPQQSSSSVFTFNGNNNVNPNSYSTPTTAATATSTPHNNNPSTATPNFTINSSTSSTSSAATPSSSRTAATPSTSNHGPLALPVINNTNVNNNNGSNQLSAPQTRANPQQVAYHNNNLNNSNHNNSFYRAPTHHSRQPQHSQFTQQTQPPHFTNIHNNNNNDNNYEGQHRPMAMSESCYFPADRRMNNNNNNKSLFGAQAEGPKPGHKRSHDTIGFASDDGSAPSRKRQKRVNRSRSYSSSHTNNQNAKNNTNDNTASATTTTLATTRQSRQSQKFKLAMQMLHQFRASHGGKLPTLRTVMQMLKVDLPNIHKILDHYAADIGVTKETLMRDIMVIQKKERNIGVSRKCGSPSSHNQYYTANLPPNTCAASFLLSTSSHAAPRGGTTRGNSSIYNRYSAANLPPNTSAASSSSSSHTTPGGPGRYSSRSANGARTSNGGNYTRSSIPAPVGLPNTSTMSGGVVPSSSSSTPSIRGRGNAMPDFTQFDSACAIVGNGNLALNAEHAANAMHHKLADHHMAPKDVNIRLQAEIKTALVLRKQMIQKPMLCATADQHESALEKLVEEYEKHYSRLGVNDRSRIAQAYYYLAAVYQVKDERKIASLYYEKAIDKFRNCKDLLFKTKYTVDGLVMFACCISAAINLKINEGDHTAELSKVAKTVVLKMDMNDNLHHHTSLIDEIITVLFTQNLIYLQSAINYAEINRPSLFKHERALIAVCYLLSACLTQSTKSSNVYFWRFADEIFSEDITTTKIVENEENKSNLQYIADCYLSLAKLYNHDDTEYKEYVKQHQVNGNYVEVYFINHMIKSGDLENAEKHVLKLLNCINILIPDYMIQCALKTFFENVVQERYRANKIECWMKRNGVNPHNNESLSILNDCNQKIRQRKKMMDAEGDHKGEEGENDDNSDDEDIGDEVPLIKILNARAYYSCCLSLAADKSLNEKGESEYEAVINKARMEWGPFDTRTIGFYSYFALHFAQIGDFEKCQQHIEHVLTVDEKEVVVKEIKDGKQESDDEEGKDDESTTGSTHRALEHYEKAVVHDVLMDYFRGVLREKKDSKLVKQWIHENVARIYEKHIKYVGDMNMKHFRDEHQSESKMMETTNNSNHNQMSDHPLKPDESIKPKVGLLNVFIIYCKIFEMVGMDEKAKKIMNEITKYDEISGTITVNKESDLFAPYNDKVSATKQQLEQLQSIYPTSRGDLIKYLRPNLENLDCETSDGESSDDDISGTITVNKGSNLFAPYNDKTSATKHN